MKVNLLLAQNQQMPAHSTQPVIRVDVPSPTADKPQSKLCYTEGSWWALLPKSTGPSLSQRSAAGWTEHPEIAAQLKGVPGRADVWGEKGKITAVGVDPEFLTVFRIEKKGTPEKVKWKTSILATLRPPSSDYPIETATIAKAQNGSWWVAAVADEKVYVWNNLAKAKRWSSPYLLAEGLDKDDICVITELPDGVGVIWSNQIQETVNIRIHKTGSPVNEWNEATTIEAGNATADDHLNTALAPDGTLWVATKNSLDEVGKPQLVLRVRSPKGEWRNYPYAVLAPPDLPSRPIVVATEDPEIVLTGHTIYHNKQPNLGKIVFGQIDTTQTEIVKNEKVVIAPYTAGWDENNRINDVTGPKKPYPLGVPWIILASDREGQVYEADLRPLIRH